MSNAASPKTVMRGRGLVPKKSFGQNFMMDQRTNILFASAVHSFGSDSPVVEIGAGTGSLTEHLLTVAPVVHAVERDRDLIPILKESFLTSISEGKLIIHEADGKRFDISAIFSAESPGVLVGNLPYHLSSSIILLALQHYSILRGAIFLLQKEVAERLSAAPNCKQYGFLTVVLQLAFSAKIISQVDRKSFWPVPKVDSAILQLTRFDAGISKISDVNSFISFVKEIFQKRRKKLSTILGARAREETFRAVHIDPNLRPENLTPQQFLKLYLELESGIMSGIEHNKT